MPVGNHNNDQCVGLKAKQYAAGGLRDLVADSPDTKSCARRIVLLAAGDLTNCFDYNNTERGPFTSLPAGYIHDMSCSSVLATVAFIAYW